MENTQNTQNIHKALICQTETFTSDLCLNGPIQADIWVRTTNTEAAVAVAVVPGRAMRVPVVPVVPTSALN
ncbi:MAG: hypothetical protein WAP57_07755 [Aquabacterium commune]|uniref:hypothetical protein n=1 Tax=Aquabacterium TaxID=92793 RepID=UPI001DCBD0C5|nr:hypothetical protein [Aquabacterium sp.]MBT9609439.1 hypothetical protein [Aquabacterium sp.]